MLFTAILLIALRQEQTGSAPQPSMTDVASLQAKAQVGDADAQVQLGQAYEGGSGVRRNNEEAAKWYRKAANQGNQAAEVAFGILLWTGRGVPEDKAKAITWYRKAAWQGNGSAMFNLGTAYYNGEGAPIDAVRALAWFLLAEDHGSSLSKDAVQRFEKTARPNEFEEAYALIARMYVVGDEVRQNYADLRSGTKKLPRRGMLLRPLLWLVCISTVAGRTRTVMQRFTGASLLQTREIQWVCIAWDAFTKKGRSDRRMLSLLFDGSKKGAAIWAMHLLTTD